MRILFALLALCISFSAQAIPITLSGASGNGNFEIGAPVQGMKGGYLVTSFGAKVDACPSGQMIIDPETGEEIHDWYDPITGIEAADCTFTNIGGFSDIGFGFNVFTGFFFKLDPEHGTPRVASPGHSDLFLGPDGTYSYAIYTHVGLFGGGGSYAAVGYPLCSPFPGGGATGGCFPGEVFPAPEPTAAALLAAPALALWGLRRRRSA